MTQRQRNFHSYWPWFIPLLVALLLRLTLWDHIPRTGLISDEGEYVAASNWLALGRGFDWYQGYLWTRAPLYPLFIATHVRLFGSSLTPIVVSQIILSLGSVILVFLLAKRLAPSRPVVAGIAALASGLYLPFALYTQVMLSETVFIVLILTALYLLSAEQLPAQRVGLAGVMLGLATLTRSLTLGFLPIVLIWLLRRPNPTASHTSIPGRRSSIYTAAFSFLLALTLTIAPWTLYNSRMYGGTVLIDTSGAFNLFLGARTAYDGKRSDAQVRDVVLGMLGQPTSVQVRDTCAPFPGVLPSQAARQAAMSKEALCLITARPLAFAEKSLREFIDLFQINYTGAERFTTGFSTGRLDPIYILALFLLDDTLYVVTLPLAIIGWALARSYNNQPIVALTGLWWVYNLAVAPLLFAINRFRLPLMPLVFIFAAWAVAECWQRIKSPKRRLAIQSTLSTHPQPTVFGSPRSVIALNPAPFLILSAVLSLLLFGIAATPYAYLEPIDAGQDSRWASYFGRYPSSLAITQIALEARSQYQNDQRLAAAIQEQRLDVAQQILATEPLGPDMRRLGAALIAARAGDIPRALALLPQPAQIAQSRDALAATLRGDFLRTLGDQPGALAIFSARYVDDANPVAWAWQWLQPAPTTRINLGGSLDLGYINGCYLGEGESSPPANFRWCTDGAQLRFPYAANGQPQTLVLRADGRAWQPYATTPVIHVSIAGQEVGQWVLNTTKIEEYALRLPPAPPGSDLIITLHTPTFVPDAARYNSQQSETVVGQVQYLGIRLDWAEIR